jgi:hypothetical protein
MKFPILKILKLLLASAFLLMMLFAFVKPKSFEESSNIYVGYSESKFRPVLDSSIVCSHYETWGKESKLDFFYIVEQMPKPKISTNEIENKLEQDIRFNKQELSYNNTIYFQCIVNCNGNAGDFQITKCPDELVNIGCQVLNVIRIQLSEWEPPVQRDKNVDILALIAVTVNNGRFEVFAPLY